MKKGNWVPLDKSFLKYLPHYEDRSFSKLEAGFSIQCDFDNNKMVSVAGYAKLWRWSRNKVKLFFNNLGIYVDYQQDTKNKQNQKGQIRDRSRTDKGQIRFINNKGFKVSKDRSRTDKGQIKDTTINNNTNTNTKDICKPENWKPNKKFHDWVNQKGFNLSEVLTEAERCMNHFEGKPAKNWNKTIYNWITSKYCDIKPDEKPKTYEELQNDTK